MTSNASRRRYELDWLRVLAILIVFVYHSSRFFNLGDWHVKNINTFVWVEIWNVFATRWMMPLFFIISGASLFYAIAKSGDWSRFYVDKFMRLMIPVLVASVTHSALQVYLERLTHGQFSGSFLSFLPEYFNGVYLGIGMPGNFAFHGMHLWYLLFLFVYSLICYRLFIWLKGRGREILNRIMSWFTIPGLMYVGFSIPLLMMKGLIPRAVLDVGNEWVIAFISSFIIIIMLYMLLVRKFELFRFLFGMKTTHPFFDIFRKRGAVIILHVLYVSLIVFAVTGASRSRSPMPLKYDPDQDII